MSTPDPDTLTADQLRSETHRLLDLSRKVNAQYSFMARALKRRLKAERTQNSEPPQTQGE
jgi:hypothetical protein